MKEFQQKKLKYYPLHEIMQKSNPDTYRIKREAWVQPPAMRSMFRYATLLEKEPWTIQWMNTFSEKTVFLDIGCNIGVYTLYAYMIGVHSIYAIDPLPCNIYELLSTIEINCASNIFPICGMISPAKGLVAVAPNEAAISKFDYKPRSLGDYAGAGVIMHPSVIPGCSLCPTLNRSSFEQLSRLGITDIKIDVDGAEHEVLEVIGPLFETAAFRSVAIEVRESTVDYVNEFFNEYSIRENHYFRNLSYFEERIKKGYDAMMLFQRV